MVVNDFRFVRWNHASLGRAGTGRRHYRNRSRVVVSRRVVWMAVMVVLLLVVMLLLGLRLVTAGVAVR